MSNASILDFFSRCFSLPSTQRHFIAYVLVNVPFVLPLCLYILVLGARQWRGGAKFSHTDFFTYHMVLVQLGGIVASCVLNLNVIFHSEKVVAVGIYLLFVTFTAVVVFQIFTCVERYLAVVHPVTYLRLKSRTWTRVRNVGCACVWLQSVIQSSSFPGVRDFAGFFCAVMFYLACGLLVAVVCNISVLCALMRPPPGEGARGNTSKQKALLTITAITATFLLKLVGDVSGTFSFLLSAELSDSDEEYDQSCGLYFSILWFTLPSSLVLPLLFLHRNQKLLCCKGKK